MIVLAISLLNVFLVSTRSGSAGDNSSNQNARPGGAAAQSASAPATALAGAHHNPLLTQPGEQDILDRFSELSYTHSEGWDNRSWLGIRTTQNPNDVWIIQEIIVEQPPDFVIECGTARAEARSSGP